MTLLNGIDHISRRIQRQRSQVPNEPHLVTEHVVAADGEEDEDDSSQQQRLARTATTNKQHIVRDFLSNGSSHPLRHKRLTIHHWQLRDLLGRFGDVLIYVSNDTLMALDPRTDKAWQLTRPRLDFSPRCLSVFENLALVGSSDGGCIMGVTLLAVEPYYDAQRARASSEKEYNLATGEEAEDVNDDDDDVEATQPVIAVRRRNARLGGTICNSICQYRFGNDIKALVCNNDKTIKIFNCTIWAIEGEISLPTCVNHASVSNDCESMHFAT